MADRKEQQVIPYLHLRLLIGVCGSFLPLACLFYGLLPGHEVADSVSDFYYTGIRDIFVGILFTLAFFLITYKGYEAKDSIIANFGFFFALGVALFPCKGFHPNVHLFSAFLLFCVFIFFSLVLFTKSRDDKRNRVYRICGWIMVVCIVGIGVTFTSRFDGTREAYNITFWLESIALCAFSISWLTKGEFISQSLLLASRVRDSVRRRKRKEPEREREPVDTEV
jgi:peptidoglycan/LPS O-acetylase OafA/YrhL